MRFVNHLRGLLTQSLFVGLVFGLGVASPAQDFEGIPKAKPTKPKLTREEIEALKAEKMAAKVAKEEQRLLSDMTPEKAAKKLAKQAGSEFKAPSWQATPSEKSPTFTQRETVAGYGQWPAGTPAWFPQLDSDRDGQIGLYEWHAQGLKIADYERFDLNNDGFLTTEEWLIWTRRQSEAGDVAIWNPAVPMSQRIVQRPAPSLMNIPVDRPSKEKKPNKIR